MDKQRELLEDAMLVRRMSGPISMHDHDPLFEPIGKDAGPQNSSGPFTQGPGSQSAGSAGQTGHTQTGASVGIGTGSSGSVKKSAGVSVNITTGPPGYLLVLRDAMGGMGFIGPFPDEDDALDYVKLHGINGIYWVLVTELQSP